MRGVPRRVGCAPGPRGCPVQAPYCRHPHFVNVIEAVGERQRRSIQAYLVATAGPVVLGASSLLVRDVVEPGAVALVLLLTVLGAALSGGRGPATAAVLLSFIALSVRYLVDGTSPYDLQEFQVMAVFVIVALVAGELVRRGLESQVRIARAKFREARLGRVLAAASAGVALDNLVGMVEHELADELELEMVRYEPESRTSTDYHVDPRGDLHRKDERLSGLQLRLPAEPVRVPVEVAGREFGQLLLIPQGRSHVTREQLLLTANFASLLAGLLDESPRPSGPASQRRSRRDDRGET